MGQQIYEFICPDCLAERVWLWDLERDGEVVYPLCPSEACGQALCVMIPKYQYENEKPKETVPGFTYSYMVDQAGNLFENDHNGGWIEME